MVSVATKVESRERHLEWHDHSLGLFQNHAAVVHAAAGRCKPVDETCC